MTTDWGRSQSVVAIGPMALTLGIDPSLRGFGWVILNPDVLGAARVVKHGVYATDSKSVFVARYLEIRAMISGILADNPGIANVGVESPPYGELWSEGLYALFVYVNEAMYIHKKDVVYFDPSTLKMLARLDPSIRRGTMDKADMVEAVKAETGLRLNHNEADAYLIARSASRFWDFESGVLTEEDLTPSEKRSFYRVRTITKGAKAGVVEKKGLVFREGSRFFKFSKLAAGCEWQ